MPTTQELEANANNATHKHYAALRAKCTVDMSPIFIREPNRFGVTMRGWYMVRAQIQHGTEAFPSAEGVKITNIVGPFEYLEDCFPLGR